MLILDANVIVAAVLGRSLAVIEAVAERAVLLLLPAAQYRESQNVLAKLNDRHDHGASLARVMRHVRRLAPDAYAPLEAQARERLSERGQADWPVLASALALDADIWSNDRDFFGVGVAVWTTPNVRFAREETA